MSDPLLFALDSCNAALVSLKSPPSPSEFPTPHLPILRNDLLSLLTLIYTTTTKISLALNPSSPSYSAAIPLLQDLSKHLSALLHCTHLFSPPLHGSTLVKETTAVVTDVLQSLRSFLSTFIAIQSRHSNPDEYLVRTGSLHQLIDNARSKHGIPPNNLVAIQRRWAQDTASFEDSFRELSEILQDAHTDPQHDDGWAELGIVSTTRMDQQELARSNNVHTILRLSIALLNRIQHDFLSTPPVPSESKLDHLLLHSSAILAASDNLVASLYPPQDPSTVTSELHAFENAIAGLNSSIHALSSQHSSSEDSPGTSSTSQKWFAACFAQIFKNTRSQLGLPAPQVSR